jgi:hypothetical protein
MSPSNNNSNEGDANNSNDDSNKRDAGNSKDASREVRTDGRQRDTIQAAVETLRATNIHLALAGQSGLIHEQG